MLGRKQMPKLTRVMLRAIILLYMGGVLLMITSGRYDVHTKWHEPLKLMAICISTVVFCFGILALIAFVKMGGLQRIKKVAKRLMYGEF